MLVLLSPFLALHAQEKEERAFQAKTFPLALVLEAAEYANEGVWRPDWPLDFPPDAFKVQAGKISGCTVEWENFSLNFRLGSEDRVEEFPLMLNETIAQAVLVYGDFGEIEEMVLTFPAGEDPWKLEFPNGITLRKYRDSFPLIIRASSGNNWFFIYLSGSVKEIVETWYDEGGVPLGAYRYYLTEIYKNVKVREIRDFAKPDGLTNYFYDSRGFLTEASDPLSQYKVLFYREDLPRYWERDPSLSPAYGAGNFSLQWDSNDFLVRLRGEPEIAGSTGGITPFVDYRYEYTLDEKGNWIERRETRMIRSLDLLVPSSGTIFRRTLEYSE